MSLIHQSSPYKNSKIVSPQSKNETVISSPNATMAFLSQDAQHDSFAFWQQKVQSFPGIGPKKAEQLHIMGIFTLGNLLHHLPHRYADPQGMTEIADLEPGTLSTFEAVVRSVHAVRRPGKKPFVSASVADNSGHLSLMFFHQPYVERQLKVGETYTFTGKPNEFRGQLTITNPIYERVPTFGDHLTQDPRTTTTPATREILHDGRILPIYPQYDTINTRWLQRILRELLRVGADSLPPEYLSDTQRKELDLMPRQEAWEKVHFPETLEEASAARRRLAFDEVWNIFDQLELQNTQRQQLLPVHHFSLQFLQEFFTIFQKHTPFPLTTSQLAACQDICQNLSQPFPTQHFVQGEVGSGKTLVAAFAICAAAKQGKQAVYVAPTTILAEQHFISLAPLAQSLGLDISLWTSANRKQHQQTPIIIATHTVFHASQELNPAVVVIDEEHRFGVAQRETFWKAREATGSLPHIVTMTATPIPRTLAFVLYGQNQVSFLEPIPGKEKKTTTRVIPALKQTKFWEWLGEKVQQEQWQGFCIAPFIEASETEDFAHVTDSTSLLAHAQKTLPKVRFGILTGKTPATQKQEILDDLRQKRIDILIATAVIEVGIDIPEAKMIAIFSAERFGYAQLHQLRGRVGRAGQESWCFLLPSAGQGSTRLKPLETLNNGNELAELDLKQRGAGEFLGSQQSGWDTLTIGKELDLTLIMAIKELRKSRRE